MTLTDEQVDSMCRTLCEISGKASGIGPKEIAKVAAEIETLANEMRKQIREMDHKQRMEAIQNA